MRIVIIGAGLGGLSFGACAARDGHEVVLIDRNAEPGGVMTLAREGGFSFEQGPLILTDLREDEPVGAFLASLGIHLETVRDDRGLSTPDFGLFPPEDYAGPDWRKKRLEELFPADRKGIRAYYRFYDALMELRFLSGQKKSLSNKLRTLRAYLAIKPYENMNCREFTEKLFSDERLRLVFNGILADFCADPEEVQCFTLPFVNTETAFDKRIPAEKDGMLYYPSYRYIVGGCQKLPEALCAYILGRGGQFLSQTVAQKVLVEDGKAVGVRLDDGRELAADLVVGCGAARDFFTGLVGEEHLDDAYRKILRDFRPMEAVFMLHLGVDYDPSVFQKQSLCYYYGSYDLRGAVEKLRSGVYHRGEDGYLIYFPDRHAPDFAPPGRHCVTIYTVCPDRLRDGDWESRKEEYADELIRLAEARLPGLSAHIVAKKIVTAEDYRRLTHMKKSSFGGTVPVWKQQNPPHLTPVKNLIFVGQQSENGGGVPIVLLGALEAYRQAGLADGGGRIL
ncbi:MAG: NAD(P)/FAD-dependent oxidoreductase [Oscillospiraceae bacterium]|nr:NAD(P)/FAD-dependent oxidoreductase [Oscillospiraceae bacterium]